MFIKQYAFRWFVMAALVFTLVAPAAWAEGGHKVSPEEEAKLLAILRSDAPAADKAIACKRLAIDGSSAAVPDLAKLLTDLELASWARIALEAIPGAAADDALRTASDTLQGKLLVGVINSIGVRRDAGAGEQLRARLTDSDAQVAAAAAVALGRIGDAAAIEALRGQLAIEPMAVRSAVAEGLVLCAERLQADGNAAMATKIYDEVRKADVPKPRVSEATRGAILARGQDGIPLLMEQLQSPDEGLFQVALGTAREFAGGEVDRVLADQVAQATPERGALILQAMADRPKTIDLARVLQFAASGSKPVRIAAVGALGRVGNESCLATLLDAGTDPDAELATSANAALAALPGEKVNAQIVALLPTSAGAKYRLLIDTVGQRRIEATPLLVKALEHADAATRAVALTALGKTVGAKDLPVLIAQVVAPAHAADREVAERALKEASVRMPDREACATELAAAVDRASTAATKGAVLEVLAAVGGAKALEAVGAAAKSSDPQLQDVSTRALGEWMTEDAAPVLLDLAKTIGEDKYKVRALRGYIRIARQFVLPEEQRVEMCQQALAVAQQPAEKKLVLDVLKRYPSVATLKMAVAAMPDAELKAAATAATLAIAQKLVKNHVDVSEILAGADFEPMKVSIVKAEYGADSTWKDVTEALVKQLGDSPLVKLPDGYNACFGGDPAPGVAKQLKIQYEISGKPGEASFAEDAVVLLPMPK
ncbi:MAG: PBS lyase [Pirellulales bacterium]|nr:PBS lyase [Pirellulales bacterium]